MNLVEGTKWLVNWRSVWDGSVCIWRWWKSVEGREKLVKGEKNL